ncbi:hypothetical protein [Niabella ginsengisoli]|uniref:DUF937 domain-containing protein n=1 Tax=Niabella ginsengisoli TaxID=522298 RepID=A0ABS9SEY1_9BACT|nr:hypothetical protein [Niabella ginsengisoli]MCH5596917.1 hypothetical protein [Niabella ginsengisoli]
MLEQILDLVKQQGQQSVVQNADIPNEKNAEVMKEAASTITGGFQNMLSSGGLQNIIGMFGDNSNEGKAGLLTNPMVATLISQLAGNLIKKLNLSPAVANNVAGDIIPGVLDKLRNNTRSNAPENDAFNLNDLIGAFTGGKNKSNGFDFQGLISQFTGEGKVDLDEANKTVSSQAQQKQQQESGLSDLIQNFFK